MHYTIICISIICLFYTQSRTDLSKAQCPDMFLLKQANSTNLTKQQSNSIISSFYSIHDNDYLSQSVQLIVIQGNSQALNKFISNRMLFYIIILAIFIVIFITAAICCIFDRSCPPQKLRRDLKKRPYTILQFRIISILTFIFAIGIVIPGFIAFSYIPQLKTNMQLAKCSIYVVLDAVLNGQKDTGWGGFNNLYGKIENVTTYLTSSLPSMSLYLNGDQWLIEQMQAMKQMNLNIYKNNKNASLITSNPATTKIALDNGFGYPSIESRFVARGMGPNGTSNTMVTDIDKGLRTTQILSLVAYEIQIGAKRVVDSSQMILTNTNSSLQTMDMYINQLKALNQELDTFKQSFFTSLFHDLLNLIQTSFGLQILGGFACLLGVVSVYKFEIFKCNSMVNLAWTLFGLGFIGSIIVLFVTLGLGSLGYGFCNYFDQMSSNKQYFNKLGASYSQNAFTKLDACFFGDGNVLSKFNLGSQMQTVTNLFQMISTYYDYENQRSTHYVDKSISLGKITGWMNTINNYKNGVYVDYNQTITTDDNPNYAINKLNLYTKGGAGVPVCAKDRWVYDKSNCTQLNQTVYTATDAANGEALATINNSICISFNQKFSDQMTTSWTSSDLARRYKQTRGSCPNAYDKILQYGYTIIRFRDSRTNLFQGIYDQLNQIYIKNAQFNNNITTFKNKVLGFQYAVSDLSNVVSNSIDGLMVSSDCRYIVDTLKFTYNMFCINVMYDIVRIGWCAVIVAVFSIIGMIVSYIFASWFTDVQRHNKWFEQGYQGQEHVQIEQISSSEVLKAPPIQKKQQYDIGRDFEKLGQFTSYIGKSKKQKQKQQQQIKKNIVVEKVNSDDSSQEQNPYAKQ